MKAGENLKYHKKTLCTDHSQLPFYYTDSIIIKIVPVHWEITIWLALDTILILISYVWCIFIPIILEFRDFYKVTSVGEAANIHTHPSYSKLTVLVTQIFCLALCLDPENSPKNQNMASTINGLLEVPLRIVPIIHLSIKLEGVYISTFHEYHPN